MSVHDVQAESVGVSTLGAAPDTLKVERILQVQ
jgi:hypothetical protein